MWKRIVLLLFFSFFTSVFSAEFDSDIRHLLQTQIYPVLSQELWRSRDAYDTSMFLLIPCSYAFEKNNADLQKRFSEHFQRFTDSINSPEAVASWEKIGVLNREHYLMLLSFFIRNCAEYDSPSLITPEMVRVVEAFIVSEWHAHQRPWSRKLFPMKDHLERILSGERFIRSNGGNIPIIAYLRIWICFRWPSWETCITTTKRPVLPMNPRPYVRRA